MIERLEQLGVFDVVLPFLLIFGVFAVSIIAVEIKKINKTSTKVFVFALSMPFAFFATFTLVALTSMMAIKSLIASRILLAGIIIAVSILLYNCIRPYTKNQ